MEGTIGEIRLFAGTFAPRGWEFCQGQLIAISQNDVLFTILGTTYGGDGVQTFGLPSFAGRLAAGAGQGRGLSEYSEGELGGSETVTILTTQLPQHTHAIQATMRVGGPSDGATPEGTFPGVAGSDIYAEASNGGTMAANMVTGQTTVAGNSMPLPIMQPFLAINVIICTEGVYPSRP